MKTTIEHIINEIEMKIAPIVPNDRIKDISLILYRVLEPYEITSKKKEIMTVNQNDNAKILQIFMVAKKLQGCTEKTLNFYWSELRKFLASVNKPIQEITANDIRYYLACKTCSNRTKDNTLRIIKSFFSWCTAEEYIPRNICVKIAKIKSDSKEKLPFTEEEVEKLRFGAEDLRTKALIEVLLSTACRVTEVSRMDRKDIKGDEMVVLGKGNKERTVYLNAKALFALGEYLKTREDNNPALFVSMDRPHDRLRTSSIEIVIRNLGRAVGVKAYPHKFRRTAATFALNRGMPIEQVQQMLGHEQPGTTLIYAQTAKENLKASHKKFVI